MSQIYMIIPSARFYFWLAEQAKIFINSHGARWLPTEYAFKWTLYIIYSKKYTKYTIIIAGTNKFISVKNQGIIGVLYTYHILGWALSPCVLKN